MSLRAMPHLHVMRPSDANETLDLVERYLSAKSPPPTALIMSRQDMPVFSGDDALASQEGAHLGGYVVRERDDAQFTLVSTGSEVGVCLAAQEELLTRGIVTRVVALPCWACFEAQPLDYRTKVLSRHLPSVSLEAGATLGWSKYADEAIGIDSFGLSAPGAYVLDYFNINPATVVTHVETVLAASK
jgi:transketolase